MIKKDIIVPVGIRYISDWAKLEDGYRLENFNYPHIVNKQLTGCGFTEYCLSNNLNIVLCSPRKILLENKEGQHKDEVLYVNNIMGLNDSSPESYDSELTKQVAKATKSQLEQLDYEGPGEENTKKRASTMKASIVDYVETRKEKNLPFKILVTYDSFRHVKAALISLGLFDSFYIVIDEFQSIFVDSKFKSSTEIEFYDQLRGVNNVCFVSATPMIDKYLEKLPDFSSLPYYEFDWASEDKNRVIVPRLEIKATKSVTAEANKVISDYRSGRFLVHAERDEEGNVINVVSKEAVLYFNSVKHICQLIKKNNLTQEECNVICARTHDNEEKVRQAFGVTKKNFMGVGAVPKKGEPHKMFTFCTRTVYLGADFYSTNARSFIFSDANVDSLSVDISLDLPQILGRQRLSSNPWKNSATFYFRPLQISGEISQEAFDETIKKKVEATNNLLSILDNLPLGGGARKELVNTLDTQAKLLNYRDNYVAVNHHSGSSPVPVFNNLVMIAEQRAFDIQQVDYKDRFKVFSTLEDTGREYNIDTDDITKALAKFDSLPNFSEKMKFLCVDEEYSELTRLRVMRSVPDNFDCYYRVLGPETIKRFSFRKYEIETEYMRIIQNSESEELVKDVVLRTFKIGGSYSKPFIKSELSKIYKACNYTATAKAVDLSKFFELKECRERGGDSDKRPVVLKIISIKEV